MPKLDWLTRPEDEKVAAAVPYRLLEAVPQQSYGDENTENILIQGDNLEALKSLLPFYAGRVKCIFIDPPYNTRTAFESYDDNLEHTQWLAMMYPRLELLRDLLAENGSIWVTIDDNESHYLKVIMDEVFGRKSFVANVVWQKRTSRENRKAIGSSHDHILVYSPAGPLKWKEHRNLLPDSEKGFSNPDGDPKGRWRSIPFSAQGFRTNQMYKIETPTGRKLDPPKGRCWGATEPEYLRLKAEGRIYFPKNGTGRPRVKKYEWEESGLAPNTWWTAKDCGDNEESKKEILALFPHEQAFDTPKPERLIRHILLIASNPGDLVLDSFLGSGTTAAVAHKMGRHYIGVESGDQATTYCKPRLESVVKGEQGGVSTLENWQGGGGFRFVKLGASIFDEHGRINPVIRFDHLAAHVWFSETRTPLMNHRKKSPFLGIHDDTAYYLLYNGILGDKRPEGGNVLTRRLLADLPEHDGKKVIYGESSRLSTESLRQLGITFKQTPYDVKAR